MKKTISRMKSVKTILILLIIFSSCQQSDMDKYQSLVEKELNSNKKVNDLFFGISLGMTNKEFYTHCWNFNQKGLFTNGTNSMSVFYALNQNELKQPASMNFFPEFQDDKIYKMWARFQYDGWMPWNKTLGSDSLLLDVLKLYQKWYPSGNPFMKIEDEKHGTVYVKVDGNRRIILRRFDDVDVQADYDDLSIKNNKEK